MLARLQLQEFLYAKINFIIKKNALGNPFEQAS